MVKLNGEGCFFLQALCSALRLLCLQPLEMGNTDHFVVGNLHNGTKVKTSKSTVPINLYRISLGNVLFSFCKHAFHDNDTLQPKSALVSLHPMDQPQWQWVI